METKTILDDIILTEEDQRICAGYLINFASLNRGLTHSRFTEDLLLKLMRYEILTKGRKDIMNRLHGRYTKLRRQREMEEINRFIGAYRHVRSRG